MRKSYLLYSGSCIAPSPPDAPQGALDPACGAGGFLQDFGLAGSYYEFASSICAFEDGFSRVSGYGGELIVFPIRNVIGKIGCSGGPTHNYIVVEIGSLRSSPATLAHEIGHACGLLHINVFPVYINDPNNLMYSSAPGVGITPSLRRWQKALIRNSKHCVFF